ncbi:hypothetical protein VTI28DRAFT_5759 [Corynascus sepedonium]
MPSLAIFGRLDQAPGVFRSKYGAQKPAKSRVRQLAKCPNGILLRVRKGVARRVLLPHSSARKKPATNDEIAASSGGLPFALLSVCTNRVAKRFDFCL